MTRRIARALLVAMIIAAGVGWRPQVAAQSPLPPCGIAMRVLVVSKDGNASNAEVDLPAITTALEYVGTPYDVFITDQTINPNPLTLETSSCTTSSSSETPARALYQGIILTNNTAAGGYSQMIADYEKKFGIRQVTWYNTWPSVDDGLIPVSGSGNPVTATLTPAGQAVFPYIKTGAGIDIRYAWTIFAKPADSTTVPLLTFPDTTDPDHPYALAAVHTYPDGRENLVMTFDSNPYLLHSMLLSYGVINWVTNGVFIGERHTYISPQVDDIFIDDEQWLEATACGTSVDNTGFSHRMTGADLTTVSNWQALKRQQPLTPDLKITMAFNGFGTSPDYTFKIVGSNDTIVGGSTGGAAGLSSTDTLTLGAIQQQQNYYWASHTYDHENLDRMNYTDASLELSRNNTVATQLGLDDYTLRFMVQPDVSGLANAEFLRAAYDNGIRYVLSNTSKPGQNNPTPNTGYWNAVDPRIFVIPRRANNLFFNVAKPADWVQEYNCLYGPNGTLPGFHFDHNLSYDEILDFISNELLADLLRGELDPWMFHQTNLAAFTASDGSVHTLLGDLLDRTFDKYASYMTFPIVSPSIDILAGQMKDRTTIRTRGIDATIKPGVAIVFSSPADVTVPVTGLKNGAELYAGQWISWVPLSANVPATVPLLPPFVSETSSSSDGTGTRTATVSTTQPGDLVLAFVGAGGPVGQSATVSGAGLTWTLVKRQNSQAGTSEIWAASAPTRLTNAIVTSTLSTPTADQSLTVVPFAGSGGIGAVASASAASGGPTVSLTTTKRSSLVYAIGNDTNRAVGRTLGANQWMVHEFVDTKASDTFWVQALSSPVPNAGTAVRVNDTAPKKDSWNFVAVEIIPAPKPTSVPAVVNMTQASATSAIVAAGLNVGIVKYELNTAVPGGLVISQNPVGGTKVMTETKVDLVISTPRPVPDQTLSSRGIGTWSLDIPATSGQLLVAFVNAAGPSGSTQSVTISGGGLTWTRVARANAQSGTAEIWKAKASANATVRVTSTEAKNGYTQTLTVVTFNGAGDTGASRAASASSGALTTSLTTTKPYSLVYGVGYDSATNTPRTVGSGQVMIYEFSNTSYSNDFWLQARDTWIAAAPTTVQVNDTIPTSGRWNLAVVEIAVP